MSLDLVFDYLFSDQFCDLPREEEMRKREDTEMPFIQEHTCRHGYDSESNHESTQNQMFFARVMS